MDQNRKAGKDGKYHICRSQPLGVYPISVKQCRCCRHEESKHCTQTNTYAIVTTPRKTNYDGLLASLAYFVPLIRIDVWGLCRDGLREGIWSSTPRTLLLEIEDELLATNFLIYAVLEYFGLENTVLETCALEL